MKRLSYAACAFAAMIALSACTGGGNAPREGISRADAAVVVCEELGFEGGDKKPVDVAKDDDRLPDIEACVSRSIFDEAGASFRLRPDDSLTRYELAKVSLYSYAALLCVDDETLEAGSPSTVEDIGDLSVESRWYIRSALGYGFVETEDGNFFPQKKVEEDELRETLRRVKERAKTEAVGFEEYERKKLENFSTFPHVDVPADLITVYLPDGDRGHNLAACTLQGLVNRDSTRLYVDYGGYRWMSDYAVEKGYFLGYEETVSDIHTLLSKFADKLQKVVIYDPSALFTVNTAMDIAGAEGRVVISPDMLSEVQSLNPHTDVFDIRTLGLHSQYEAQNWSYEHCFEYLRRDVIGWTYYGEQTDYMRDYIVQMRIPTLWIPGNSSPDYDERTAPMVGNILQKFPVNIPVLGFQYAGVNGEDMGVGEFTGVQFCGEYGKYTAVFDTVGNLSWHTAVKVPAEKRVLSSKKKTFGTYSPQKKYVAVTMTESGDAPCYIQYGFNGNQWSDEGREDVPYSYCYGLLNYDLNPLLTQYWGETMTENNYFFGAISGLGYSYPLGGFGNKGAVNDSGVYMNRRQVMLDHYKKANEMCRRLGIDAMGIYSYSSGFWSEYDYKDFDEMIASQMTEVRIFAADMHRAVPVLTEEQLLHDTAYGQTIFHCSTYWGAGAGGYGGSSDVAHDEIAVQYLTEEIVSNTMANDGQFYHCMAYSWNFGPRRVKMVMDRIQALYPDTYVFVTLDELYDLYQQSKN